MAREDWPYGPTLTEDRQVRYFSPSSLTLADPDSNEGCLRKWWYEKVAKLKPEGTKAQAIGTELHAQIENYLLTGDKSLGTLALSGAFMIPPPHPRLLIEHDIVGGDPKIDPMIRLANAPLKARGIPVAGYIDLVHDLGTNRGVTDVEDTIDPPNTVEIIDWKTSGDPRWIKSPKEVANTIQMTTYGKWAITVTPTTEWVRLSHGYFITKGRHTPRKVTLRVHRDQINDRWNHIDKLAGSIVDIAKETNPDKVPGNGRACDAFRGCPHMDYCSYAMHNSLAELGFSDDLELPGDPPVSLLSSLKSKAAPAPATINLEDEKLRLVREETLARWPGLDKVFEGFAATGLGFPKLAGDAATAYVAICGSPSTAAGGLAEHEFDDPEVLFAVLEEAQGIAAAEAPVSVLAPEAPTTPPAPAAVADAAIEAATVAPVKKARAKKAAEPAPAPEQTELPLAAHAEDVDVYTSSSTDDFATPLPPAVIIYVDCIPSVAHQSLWPVINQITEALAKKYKVDDIRCAPNDGELGYGRWRGYLGAATRGIATKLGAGHWVLDGASSEIGQVVVEALRDVVGRNGGMMVRGTR